MCRWYNFLFVILLIETTITSKHRRECYVNDVMTTVFNYPYRIRSPRIGSPLSCCSPYHILQRYGKDIVYHTTQITTKILRVFIAANLMTVLSMSFLCQEFYLKFLLKNKLSELYIVLSYFCI